MLSDAEKRAAYDQLGQQWEPGQEFRPPPNWDAGFEFSGATPNVLEAQFAAISSRPYSAECGEASGHRAAEPSSMREAKTITQKS